MNERLASFVHSIEPNRDYRTLTTQNLCNDIVNYYDSCYWDYRFAWANSKNLALHYGYWDSDIRSHSDSLLKMNEVLAQQVSISESDYILDAGCGLGGSAIWLAEHYGARVLGITLSEKQANLATRFAIKRGVSGLVKFQSADFCHTPFEDGCFDVIWGLESVCYAVEKRAFVQEAYRLLKDNGRLVIADGFAKRREFTEKEWKLILTCLNGWSVPNLATADEMKRYFKDSGFGNIDYQDISEYTMRSAKHMYRTALIHYPLQKISRILRLRTDIQNANYLAGLYQYQLMKNGLSGYAIVSALKNPFLN
ncbi:MAG: methyltransferase domain-containing protein [Methylococcaceae bacterium]|nr:methyltransferase domain-containing protein [Methylococcaceae bacterium]MCI0667775.1 methyltransferase domain-containing protein [Methylococcaceae bacterium]MCI0734101.1 methyltransferase domain-containing protein [Methylococcaceae bacterium]